MNNLDSYNAITAANLRNNPIVRLRLAGMVEGTTLIVLLFIAVPLKYVFGLPELVMLLGPLHGFSFVMYQFVLIDTVSGGGFTVREIARVVLVAIVPLGPFLNDRFLANRHWNQQGCK
jgi:integral membrane protein